MLCVLRYDSYVRNRSYFKKLLTDLNKILRDLRVIPHKSYYSNKQPVITENSKILDCWTDAGCAVMGDSSQQYKKEV